MDKEEIEQIMQKIIRMADEFKDYPSTSLASDLDKEISILRFIIGENNFISLHYFRSVHEKVVAYLDGKDKSKSNDA